MPTIPLQQFHDKAAQAIGLGERRDYIRRALHGYEAVRAGSESAFADWQTARLVAEKLGLEENAWQVTFQSRFGREEWLQPYTDVTITELADSGVKRLAVIMPGFSADCLETLEEIAIRNGEYFLESGGERYATIPCLNDGEAGMEMLETLVGRELAGWV